MSNLLTIEDLAEQDIESVVALWTRCGLVREWNDPRADIALARTSPNAAILVARLDGAIVGAVMVGHDGHRGWFYYLGIDPAMQGRGYGRLITEAGERWLSARGVAKVMLMVRPDNAAVHAFYESLGYFDQPRTVFAKWLDGRPPTP
jgi:ribosomal protein S18 acetylase RimI-like enzyme